jgi:hypothetical protein
MFISKLEFRNNYNNKHVFMKGVSVDGQGNYFSIKGNGAGSKRAFDLPEQSLRFRHTLWLAICLQSQERRGGRLPHAWQKEFGKEGDASAEQRPSQMAPVQLEGNDQSISGERLQLSDYFENKKRSKKGRGTEIVELEARSF